jgi:hypothetical protein
MHNGDGKSQAYMEDALELEQSIERVESHFKPQPSWFERHLAPVKAVVEKFKSQYGFIATAATLISDFIKPILDLTLPIAVGSLAGGAIFLVASRIFRSAREKLQGAAAVCGLFLVCSTGLLGVQHLVPGAADKGVIADAIPGASKVQKAMLASLGKIEANTERTAQGVEGVKQSVDTLKKESSDDPRKELQNLGKSFDEQGFLQSMAMCDMRAMKLYKTAGMKLPRYKAIEVLVLPSDVACLELYRDEFASYGPDLCLTSKFVNPIFALRTTAVDWLSKAYEIPERKTFVESLCGEAALREKYPQLYGGKSRTTSQLELEMRSRGPLVLNEDQAREEREKIKRLFPGATDVQTASPSQPSPAVQANSAPPPQQPRGDAVLGAGDIRRDIIGKNLNHAGKMDITFGPDGSFASGDGRVGRNGKYRLEADGRLCWQDNMGFDGCFQYFRENGVLKVRRNDPKSRDLIGIVKVTGR